MTTNDVELENINEEDNFPKEENNNNTFISESSGNISNTESMSDIGIDKLNEELCIKPEHWTNEYWNTITSTYKWFLHKDGYAGCRICTIGKSSVGKKSALSMMKLRIMELSYLEFEKKLIDHKSSTQHMKSVTIYRGSFRKSIAHRNMTINQFVSPSLNNALNKTEQVDFIARINKQDYICPQCKKVYKMRKALAKHVYNCKNENSTEGFLSPCGCASITFTSIASIDDHNLKEHNGSFQFNCNTCPMQFKNATHLYRHMILMHDYEWNPYEYMPTVTETAVIVNENQNSGARVGRNKWKTDDIYYRYENDEPIISSEIKSTPKRLKLAVDETAPNNKIEKSNEKSRLKLSFDHIHHCEYCGGKFLTANIFNTHMETRHPSVGSSKGNVEENLNQKYKEKLLAITESLNASSSTNINEPAVINGKRHYTKRKTVEQPDTKVTASSMNPCLLTCPVCQETFSNLDTRNDHVSKLHPEIQHLICQHCGLIFTNHVNYNKHLEKSHGDNIVPKAVKSSAIDTYSCPTCPLVFTNTVDLNNHVNLSHTEVLIVPLIEEKPNEISETVMQPIDSIISTLINVDSKKSEACCCFHCEFVAHNKFEQAVHNLNHSLDLECCPSCNRLFFGEFCKSYLKDHFHSEHLNKCDIICNICGISMPSSFVLDKHQATGLCRVDIIEDPYGPLMSEDKLAFCCPRCTAIFAGEDSKKRFEIHNKKCTNELMDEDEFLGC